MSGSGGVPTAKDIGNKTTGLALDPFTGSGAYRSTSSAPQGRSATTLTLIKDFSKHFPKLKDISPQFVYVTHNSFCNAVIGL